jgi:hypothetical protein
MLIAAAVAGSMLAALSPPAWSEPAAASPHVTIFSAGEITPDRYTAVRHLWVEGWRSAFHVPEYAQSGDAISAIVAAAGKSGADGIVDLYCLDTDLAAEKSSYLCYALAVRVK